MNILFCIKETAMHERLGVMQLSSILKSNGHNVKIAVLGRLGLTRLKHLVQRFKPSVIGYSAMTGEHVSLLSINRELKKEFVFTAVFGGPHGTFFPNIIKEYGCDAVCRGEGDIVFPEFCRRLEHDKEYWDTPNFVVKRGDKVYENPLIPLVADLDELPFSDRDIIYEADPSLLIEGHKMFFSGRGCPYKCSYCFNVKYNDLYKGKGSVVRYRSPEKVVEEIALVKSRYPLSVVWIDDDIFLLKPREWFDRFCSLYKKEVGLPFSCNVRANLVTEESVKLLKDAGLDSVWMGVECGDDGVSNNILQRELSTSQILTASEIFKAHKVKLSTQNLVGIPVPNSYKVDLKTLDLNIAIKPTFAWSSILYPYPDTDIERYAKKTGYLSGQPPALETNKRYSLFDFSQTGEKRKIENLHKLFGLFVEFPVLNRSRNFLCRLPLGTLYTALFYLWYGYNMKIRIFPFKSIHKEIGSYIRLWWKYVRKS